MVLDVFAIAIIFVIAVTVVTAFVRGRSKDRCLKDFSGDLVTLEETTGKVIWGRLRVESTGLELVYRNPHRDSDGHDKASYILYKPEYPTIEALIRYHDELDEEGREERKRELDKTYHPSARRKIKRKTRNFLNTFRNSVIEVVNLFVGQVKRTTAGGRVLGDQDKQLSQLQQELAAPAGTAFEPLLEGHIGKKVVLEIIKDKTMIEYPCILKEYTAEFIEVMDIAYRTREDEPCRKADLVVPRKYGLIRHLGE